MTAATLALAACGGGEGSGASSPQVVVGQPVAPERFATPRPSRLQLRAANPGGGAPILMAYVTETGMDPRDVCFAIAVQRQNPAEADEHCELRDPEGGVTFFVAYKGTTVVAGHAGPRVTELLLGTGRATSQLPLSVHRGFLVALPASSHTRLALIARHDDGTVHTTDVSLPASLEPRHAHRRAGAVFDDEVGERIVQLSETELLGRFGPPAARHGDCLRYQVVGSPKLAWRFCFDDGGTMSSAAGLGY